MPAVNKALSTCCEAAAGRSNPWRSCSWLPMSSIRVHIRHGISGPAAFSANRAHFPSSKPAITLQRFTVMRKEEASMPGRQDRFCFGTESAEFCGVTRGHFRLGLPPAPGVVVAFPRFGVRASPGVAHGEKEQVIAFFAAIGIVQQAAL